MDMRRRMTRQETEQDLHDRGWVEPAVSPRILEELDIEYETTCANPVWTRGGHGIFAPVWVYGTIDRAGVAPDSSVMKLLEFMRDDVRDQRLLCGELALDSRLPSRVRRAAANYIIVLDERERGEEDG